MTATIAVLSGIYGEMAHSPHQHAKSLLCFRTINDITILWLLSIRRVSIMLWYVVILSELKLPFLEGGEASEDTETPLNKIQGGCEISMTWEMLKVTGISSPIPKVQAVTECWGREMFSNGAAYKGSRHQLS